MDEAVKVHRIQHATLPLNTPSSDDKIFNICGQCLKDILANIMFSKAEKFASVPGSIILSPGSTTAKLVESKSGPLCPEENSK